MNDVLNSIVRNSHLYLGNAITAQEYRQRMVELMRDTDDNDLKLLADLFTTNTMHLRKGH